MDGPLLLSVPLHFHIECPFWAANPDGQLAGTGPLCLNHKIGLETVQNAVLNAGAIDFDLKRNM
jgi:hypothetical protein